MPGGTERHRLLGGASVIGGEELREIDQELERGWFACERVHGHPV